MNDRQRSKHDSNILLRLVCNKDPWRALWSSLPAWVLLYDRFLAKISYANACSLIQTTDTTGITEAKKDARTKMIDSTIEVSGALATLGFLNDDPELEKKASVIPSDLIRLPDSDVDDRATAILQLARALPAPPPGSTQMSATDAGITSGKLDLLETRIETYNLLLGSPRDARGEKTVATENLQQCQDDTDAILTRGLDKLVYQFKASDFFKEYWNARKLITTGGGGGATPPPTSPTAPPTGTSSANS